LLIGRVPIEAVRIHGSMVAKLPPSSFPASAGFFVPLEGLCVVLCSLHIT
jgi:hypothetical protein